MCVGNSYKSSNDVDICNFYPSQENDSTLGSGNKLDKEKEQAKLELEMQKRRERIERWRDEKKKKAMKVYN